MTRRTRDPGADRPDPPEVVDLGRVRAALARLDELVARHPHLIRADGPPTEADITALAADLEHAMSDSKLSHNLALRLAPDLRDRIEAYRATLAADLPEGVREPTLSDAARMLILRGLDAVEGVPRG